MKAKLYFGALIMEIRLSDDKQFFSTEQESQKEFVKRVSDQVKTDYLEDLEITHEFDLKKTKGKVTQSLQRRLTVIPNGVEKELILEVLESRKADIDPEFSENTFGLSEEPAKNSPTPKKKPLKEEKPK